MSTHVQVVKEGNFFLFFFLFCDIQLCFFTRTLGHRDCHLCEESFHGASAKRYLTNHMKKHTIKKECKYLFFLQIHTIYYFVKSM